MPTLILALLLPFSHATEVFVRGADLCATGLDAAKATGEVCYKNVPLENAGLDLVEQVRGFEANLDDKGEIKDSTSENSNTMMSIAGGIGLSALVRKDVLAKYARLRVTNLAADEEHALKTKSDTGEDRIEIPFLARVEWATADAPAVEHVGFVAGRMINVGELDLDDRFKPGSTYANELFARQVRVDFVAGEGLTKDLVANTLAPAVIANYSVYAITQMIDGIGRAIGDALGSLFNSAPSTDAAPATPPATAPAPVAPPSL